MYSGASLLVSLSYEMHPFPETRPVRPHSLLSHLKQPAPVILYSKGMNKEENFRILLRFNRIVYFYL